MPVFPRSPHEMSGLIFFVLNAAEIKDYLYWIQLKVVKGFRLLYCSFIWILGHYFPWAYVFVSESECERTWGFSSGA